jgi:hypothetical protein
METTYLELTIKQTALVSHAINDRIATLLREAKELGRVDAVLARSKRQQAAILRRAWIKFEH